jgi:hypothetical protein
MHEPRYTEVMKFYKEPDNIGSAAHGGLDETLGS